MVAIAALTTVTPVWCAAAVWMPAAGGSWGTAANWNPAVVPSATDAVADFTNVDLAADATVTLDGDRVVGSLSFGDTDVTSAAGWTLAGSTATPASNFIVFQTSSGPATLNVGALAAGKTASITAKMKSTATQEVVKTGAGTLFLGYGTGTGVAQADNFLGILTMQEGTVAFNNAFALPVFAADRMVFNGGTLAWTGASLATGRLFTLAQGGGRIDNNGTGAVSLTGTAATTLAGSGARTLTFGGTFTGANTFASAINDGTGGATSIEKAGPGSWALSNAASGFTGNITVGGGGTLTVPQLGGGSVSIATGSTLALSRTAALTFTGPVTGAGNFLLSSVDTTLALTNASYSGTTTIQRGNFNLSNDSSTSNYVLGVASAGTSYGVIYLDSANFTGPLGTTGGGVTWAGSGGFSNPNAGTRTVNIGGNATPSTLSLNVGGFIAGNGTTPTTDFRLKLGDVAATSLGTVDLQNSIDLNSRRLTVVVDGLAQSPGVISGNITGTGSSTAGGLSKFGNASLKLAGNNTYSGTTVIVAGLAAPFSSAIILSSAGAFSPNTNMALTGGSAGTSGGVLGLGFADGNFTLGTGNGQVNWVAANSGGFAAYGAPRGVTLNGGASLTWGSTASFVPTGQNLILALPNADATLSFNNPVDLNAGTRTVVVNNGSADIDAALTQPVTGAGASNLVKAGAGTLVLANANTYAGTTQVTAGALLVNGSIGGTTVTANAGTTLGGTGSIAGDVSVAGKLAPGVGAGSLQIGGNLTFGATAILAIELGGSNFSLNASEDYDRVKLSGIASTLTLADAALNVSLINGMTLTDGMAFGIVQLEDGATLSGRFNGLPTDGSQVGTFNGVPLYITYSGNVGDAGVISTSGGNDTVLYSSVPEPTTLLALAMGGLLIGRRRRSAN